MKLMEQRKKTVPVIMDFSGIYQTEKFWADQEVQWISAAEISGTNCYCDDEARKLLREKIKNADLRGIHFIDSGNYHYMSAVWLEKQKEPFRLLVLDNHTDMQLPAFGGLLSCGGWIGDLIESHPGLTRVILIGPDEEAYSQTDSLFQSKTCFYSREKLKNNGKEELDLFLKKIPADIPLYISVDKDILCPGEASTTWSQGDMSLDELLHILETVMRQILMNGGTIAGMDVCGECDPGEMGASAANDRANRELLRLYQNGVYYEK